MQLRNTEAQYGAVARTFHWVIALLMIVMLGVGVYMTNVKLPMSSKFQIFGLHKSTGILILMLVTPRFLWKLINKHPIPLPNHKQWEKTLASIVHALLYVGMFTMPLTGWIGSSAKGFSVSFFGLFQLPDLVARNDSLATLMWETHEYVAYSLIVIVGLHFTGAMKHHIIDRDNTLWRMLPGKKLSA